VGHRLPTAGVFVIQREVVGREERYLERAFGEEYLDYKERVPDGRAARNRSSSRPTVC
jgi:hypothetical protein